MQLRRQRPRSSPLRTDIPLNLPVAFEEEALRLRNRLLLFRFRNLGKPRDLAAIVDRAIELRLAQIFAPLMSMVDDPAAREDLRTLARRYHRELAAAQVLDVIRDLAAAGEQLSVKEIARLFAERRGDDYEPPVMPKRIGAIIHRKLGLLPQKSHGVFVVPLSEEPKLRRLFEKYGVEAVPSPHESSRHRRRIGAKRRNREHNAGQPRLEPEERP